MTASLSGSFFRGFCLRDVGSIRVYPVAAGRERRCLEVRARGVSVRWFGSCPWFPGFATREFSLSKGFIFLLP